MAVGLATGGKLPALQMSFLGELCVILCVLCGGETADCVEEFAERAEKVYVPSERDPVSRTESEEACDAFF